MLLDLNSIPTNLILPFRYLILKIFVSYQIMIVSNRILLDLLPTTTLTMPMGLSMFRNQQKHQLVNDLRLVRLSPKTDYQKVHGKQVITNVGCANHLKT